MSTRQFDKEWAHALGPHILEVGSELLNSSGIAHPLDPVLIDALIANGVIDADDFDPAKEIAPNLMLKAFNTTVGGSIVRAIAAALTGSEEFTASHRELLRWTSSEWVGVKILRVDAAEELANVISAEVRYWPDISADLILECAEDDYSLQEVMLWLALILAEAWAPSLHPFHERVDGVIGMEAFCDLLATREKNLGVDGDTRGTAMTKKALQRALKPFGEWVNDWVDGDDLLYHENLSRLPGVGDWA